MCDLLDEIRNKLNKLLDNDLNICQHYSSIVIILYKKIVMYLNGQIDINCFRDDINELINYIEKENDVFRKLLSYDKSTLLPRIDNHIQNENGSPEYLRFVEKLRFIKNIYNGFKINAHQLCIDNIPFNMEFDIYSSIFSVIYIDTFKEILNRLESLSYDNERDERFVNCLFGEFNLKIIYRCSCNDLFEMICLHNDIDISKFPNLDMNLIKKHMSSIYKKSDVDDHINEILYNSVIENITKMKSKNCLNNNPEDVFEYLYFVSKISVVISYLNKKHLSKLVEYCNNITFSNLFIQEDVKKLIRTKLYD